MQLRLTLKCPRLRVLKIKVRGFLSLNLSCFLDHLYCQCREVSSAISIYGHFEFAPFGQLSFESDSVGHCRHWEGGSAFLGLRDEGTSHTLFKSLQPLSLGAVPAQRPNLRVAILNSPDCENSTSIKGGEAGELVWAFETD